MTHSNTHLPSWIAKLWSGTISPRFAVQYQKPTRYMEDKDLSYFRSRNPHYIPIFESNGECIYAFDNSTGNFVEHYYSDSRPEIIGTTVDELMAWIFVDLGYSGLDDIATDVASKTGFPFLDEFEFFMKSDDDSGAVDAKRMFVSQCASA